MCVPWGILALRPIHVGAAICAPEFFSRYFPCSAAALCWLHFMFTRFGTPLPGRDLARCLLHQSPFHSLKRRSFAAWFWASYLGQVESTSPSLPSLRSLQQFIFSRHRNGHPRSLRGFQA